jgi:hypothetical protein
VTTFDFWNATSGNWTDAARWSTGTVPDGNERSEVLAPNSPNPANPPYTIDITSAAVTRVLTITDPSATIDESAAGSLRTAEIDISAGTLILDGTNTSNLYDLSGTALLEFNSGAALGNGLIGLDSGRLLATANAVLLNPFNVDMLIGTGSIGVTAGHTLRLEGQVTTQQEIVFGQLGVTTSGTIQIMGAVVDSENPARILIESGRVETVAGHNAGAITLFNTAPGIFISNGNTTLDLSNFGNDVTLHSLDGSGIIRSSNAAMELHLTNADSGARLYGTMHVEADGTNALFGRLDDTLITMGAGTDYLDLSNVKDDNFTISAPSGSTVTVLIGKFGGTYTDFQDGHLTIDTVYSSREPVTFSTTGSTTTLDIRAPSGKLASALVFDGITASSHFTIGDDGHGHMQITYDAGTADIDAQVNHAIDVANAIAAAATAHIPADFI